MKRTRATGFTLMELLIVVFIVGILARVALPQFGKMTRRARAAEGSNLVGATLTAEWVYYQEQGVYTATIGDLLVDLPPEGANEHFDVAIGGAGPPVVVTATGDTGSPAAGIVVTGTMANDGTRTIATTGL